jgi:23S rRNA (uracil1939-C5)-methyltransferase
MPEAEQVRIERAVYGGSGLARIASGAVVLVPFVLPGELVEIMSAVTSGEAVLLSITEASDARVEARCPHFGRCGGCQYQHASYAEQARLKRDILAETMERGGVAPLVEIVPHIAEPWEYRNRVRLRIAQAAGQLRVGYSVRGTNEFLPINECPISTPLLIQAAFVLLDIANSDPKLQRWFTSIKEVELFMNESASRLSMTLFAANSASFSKDLFVNFCELLRTKFSELSGASVVFAPANATSRIELASWGAAGIGYFVNEETYWISRGGFFQVNRFLIGSLVDMVCEGRKGRLAWDLYAGVGLFSRVLARSFGQVTAVEANPTAINDLRSILTKLSPQHKAVQAPTVQFLRDAVLQRDRPDLIVLDPPRAGAGLEVCELLLRLAATEMVYVSCDPTTLARDLSVLQRDYRIVQANLVDLFPQTFHLETVVVLKHR